MSIQELIARKSLNTANVEILGEFSNEFGEIFVLYKHLYPWALKKPKNIVYITGDELDWGLDWIYAGGRRVIPVADEFILSVGEAREAKKIIEKRQ